MSKDTSEFSKADAFWIILGVVVFGGGYLHASSSRTNSMNVLHSRCMSQFSGYQGRMQPTVICSCLVSEAKNNYPLTTFIPVISRILLSDFDHERVREESQKARIG